jgi:hypothetical protein
MRKIIEENQRVSNKHDGKIQKLSQLLYPIVGRSVGESYFLAFEPLL